MLISTSSFYTLLKSYFSKANNENKGKFLFLSPLKLALFYFSNWEIIFIIDIVILKSLLLKLNNYLIRGSI